MGKNANTKIGTEKTHARFSASSSSRWLACPGSVSLSDEAPPPRETQYAIEGTRAHACLEYLLKHQDKPLSAAAYCSKEYGVQETIHAESAIKRLLKRKHADADLLVEEKCDEYLKDIHEDFGGTLDISFAYLFDGLEIIDYKYGVTPVSPMKNSQMMVYLLAILKKYHYNFNTLRISIYQPRRKTGGDPLVSWTPSFKDMEVWEEKFKRGIDACEKKRPPLNKGKWCFFCPAQPICPEHHKARVEKARMTFGAYEGD